MKGSFRRPLINLLATALTIAVNILSVALPLNGQTPQAIANRFQVYFVPAVYVFSIWGLIYLVLILFTIFQLLPAYWDDPHLGRIGYLYIVSCAANIAWLFCWHYGLYVPSLVVMVVLLLTLIAIYLRLDVGRGQVPALVRWLVHLPFSLYLGWITVATIANATAVLYYLNWNGLGLGQVLWTLIMLLAATAITAVVCLTRRDVAYALVIVWAFVGIGVKNIATLVVALPAFLAALIVVLVLVISLIRGPEEPRLEDLSQVGSP